MTEFLEAGRIINTHGVRGELKVEPWADSPEFLLRFKTLSIDGAAYAVTSARVHTRFVLLCLSGVGSVEDAMRLKGRVLHFARADAPLPEGTFFQADLIGCEVFDLRRNAVIGRLAEILELPAGSVYRVSGEKGDILIPERPEFTRGFDPEAHRLTVETIPGME